MMICLHVAFPNCRWAQAMATFQLIGRPQKPHGRVNFEQFVLRCFARFWRIRRNLTPDILHSSAKSFAIKSYSLFVLATPAGFEPATCPLGGGCSIQLSHGALGSFEATSVLGAQGNFFCECLKVRMSFSISATSKSGGNVFVGRCLQPNKQFQFATFRSIVLNLK